MLLIKNGRVLDPASKTDAAMDMLLDGETVESRALENLLRERCRNFRRQPA